MRPILTSLILSLFISVGTNAAYADHHRDHDRGHKEQRDRNHGKDRRPGNSIGRPGNHDNRKHHKADKRGRYDQKKHDKRYRPVNGYRPAYPPHHYRPVPPPPPPRRYGPVPPPPPPHLADMVRYATRGCRDVDVWRIDYDTYIVRYRRGNRYYTQRIYPYRDVYGPRNTISVNWTPSSPWVSVPSIHLNINL